MLELTYIPLHIIFIILTNYFPKYLIIKIFKVDTNLLSRLVIGISFNLLIFLVISFFNTSTLEIIRIYLISIFIINLFFFIKENCNFNDENLNLIFIFVVTLSLAIWIANNFQLGWDPQFFWYPKALNFFYDQNISNLVNINRPEYPYLGSLIWAIYSKISLIEYEYFGRIYYIYFYVLSVFFISELLNQKNIFRIACALLLILLSFKLSLFSGYQEILIFSVFAIISKYYYSIINEKNVNLNIFILSILLFSLIWIKNEAVLFALAFVISLVLSNKFNFNFKVKFILLFIFFIIIRLLIFNYYNFEQALQPGNYNDLNIFSEEFINLPRIILILKFFAFGIFDNLILLASIIALFTLFIVNKKHRNILYSYNIFLILCFSIIFVAYLFSSMPLEWHLKVSISRLLNEISGYFSILIILLLNQNLKRI